MKKFLFIILVFSYFSSFCQTVNLNQQAVIRPNRNNFFTVLQNGAAKRVNEGELRDTLLSLVNVSISQKATKTALSDTTFQLRSDLATKTALIDSMKDVIVAFHYRGFSPNTNISLNYEGWKDGWHAIFFHNSNYSLSYTANASATMTVTSNVYDPESQTELTMGGGSTIVTDNDIVVVKIVGGIMQTWYRVSTAKRLSVEVENLKTTKLNKSDTVSLSNRINDRTTFQNVSDSLKGIWRVPISGLSYNSTVTANNLSYPIFENNNNLVLRYGINANDEYELTKDFVTQRITGGVQPFMINSNRLQMPTNIYGVKGFSVLRHYQTGGLGTALNYVVTYNRRDSVTSATMHISTLYPLAKQLIVGNGVGIFFGHNRTGVVSSGLQFYNQLIQDSVDFSQNPQKGYLLSIRDEGKLYVKRRDGNSINTFDAVITNNEVKSKSLTLTASTNPTLDFESAINITYEITTSTANDNLTLTFTNLKDGARVSLAINATVATTLNFPSSVKKKDGTNFGAYSCVSEVLDFIVLGGNLRCLNK